MKKLAAILMSMSVMITAADAAQYCYDKSNKTLYVRGDIVNGDAKKIKGAIDSFSPEIVSITSTGGDAIDGFSIGKHIFQKKIKTHVSDYCFSACAFMWLAGKERLIDITKNTRIGVHAPYDTKTNKIDSYARKITEEYLFDIGIKKIVTLEILTYQGRESLLVLDPNKMKEWDLDWKKSNQKTKKCI